MRRKMGLLAAIMVLCLGLGGTSASWANSLTFQGVTFDMSVNASGDLILSMSGLQSATGDWTGINAIEAFEIKDTGTTYSTLSLANWTVSDNSLGANGCLTGNSSGGGCFTHNGGALLFNGANTLTFDIKTSSGAFDLTSPSLKVLFDGATTGDGHGSLLSQVVPVPGTLLMFGLGLALFFGWHQQSRHQMGRIGVAA